MALSIIVLSFEVCTLVLLILIEIFSPIRHIREEKARLKREKEAADKKYKLAGEIHDRE